MTFEYYAEKIAQNLVATAEKRAALPAPPPSGARSPVLVPKLRSAVRSLRRVVAALVA